MRADVEIEVNGASRAITLRQDGQAWIAEIDGRELAVDTVRAGDRWSVLIREHEPGTGATEPVGTGLQTRSHVRVFRSYELAIEERSPGELVVYIEGRAVALSVPQLQRWGRGPQRRRAASGGGAARVIAPMPGRIVKLLVRAGQAVDDRQPLVVVEAMKMENELRSPRAGVVTTIAVTEGMAVESGAVLIVVE
jgi:biotin carboxyl carrier protein